MSWSDFTDKMKLFWSWVWDFLEPFIEIFLSKAGPILAQAATKAVAAVAAQAISPDEKRSAAFDEIVKDLEVQGITLGAEVTTSMINAAIEAAYQGFKTKQ